MGADDGADVVEDDILNRRALADVVGDEFRVVVAVAVADEHRLRGKVSRGRKRLFGKSNEGGFAASGLFCIAY